MKDRKTLLQLGAKASEVLPNVFHLSFASHRSLIDAFLRPREFFESVEFKNKKIDRDKFEDWYSLRYGNGKFTYYQDWAAFNLPDDALQKFERKHSSDLQKSEKLLLKFIHSLEKGFYLIATSKNVDLNHSYLKHEMAHALFATNASYRRKVKKILKRLNLKPIFLWLKKENYHSSRFLDEAHSYLLDGASFLDGQLYSKRVSYRNAGASLNKIFKSTLKEMNSIKER